MKTRSTLSRMEPYIPGERRQGAIKLSSNENPRGCSPAVIRTLQEATGETHIYPDGAARALKTAVADAVNVQSNQVILGNGSDEVLTFIAATYLGPGESVLLGEHTFSQYAFAARLFDGVVHPVPMPDLAFQPEIILRTLQDLTHRGETVRIVFLCSPNNPTGLSISQADLDTLLENIPSDVLLVVDHAYIEYQESREACDALTHIDRYPNLIVLRTFSKVHGLAALRVGYGLAAPDRIAELERVRSPFNVNTFGQHAAVSALESTEFVRETQELNRNGKHRLYSLFRDLAIDHIPSEANFVTIAVPAGFTDARAMSRLLAEEGITVRPLNSFGLPQHVRITIGTPQQIDLLENALRRVVR